MLEVSIRKQLNQFLVDCTFKLGGEVLALQGESGAGKTTILNCLAGLMVPDEGSIVLHGRTLFGSEMGTCVPVRDRKVGYVFQNYALFPHMTVRENVAMGQRQQNRQAVEELLETFGVIHLGDKKPGLISGGEKQRVALARALAGQPDLLLLDEPFAALDGETREKLYREFYSFRTRWDIPVVMVTHNPLEAEFLADKVLQIHDGVVVRERYNHLEGVVLWSRRHEHYLEMGVACGDAVFQVVKPEYFSTQNLGKGSRIMLAIKPENLLLFKGDDSFWTSADNRLAAKVLKIDRTQRSGKVVLEIGGNRMVSVVSLEIMSRMPLQVGDEVICLVEGQDIQIFKI